MQGHRLGVAGWQNQPGPLAFGGADRAEDVRGLRALIVRCNRPRAAPRPAPRDLVLLPDPGFVGEPDF
jgi:hypothetical protein